MPKLFSDNPSFPTRALQIWQILISKAANRQTMTYGQLADMLGFGGAGTLADMLGHIMFYCQQKKLPPLSALVVNKDTGLPGLGLDINDLHAEREAVFKFDWYGIYPPTPEEFKQAFQTGMAAHKAKQP